MVHLLYDYARYSMEISLIVMVEVLVRNAAIFKGVAIVIGINRRINP